MKLLCARDSVQFLKKWYEFAILHPSNDKAAQHITRLFVCRVFRLVGFFFSFVLRRKAALYCNLSILCFRASLTFLLSLGGRGMGTHARGHIHDKKKATLRLREDGTLAEQAAVYMGTSGCAGTDSEGDDTSNMTVGDVSGVFVVLGCFLVLSVFSWCMRRSPPAKKAKEKRRRYLQKKSDEQVRIKKKLAVNWDYRWNLAGAGKCVREGGKGARLLKLCVMIHRLLMGLLI